MSGKEIRLAKLFSKGKAKNKASSLGNKSQKLGK